MSEEAEILEKIAQKIKDRDDLIHNGSLLDDCGHLVYFDTPEPIGVKHDQGMLCPECGTILEHIENGEDSYSSCPKCSIAWLLKNDKIGVKHDADKLEWSLLPMREVEEVIKVLMHGAKKYSRDNWMHVKPKERYLDAALRHLTARAKGEILDPESGLQHLAHSVCCILFLLWNDTEDGVK